jgi:hypothetical protein
MPVQLVIRVITGGQSRDGAARRNWHCLMDWKSRVSAILPMAGVLERLARNNGMCCYLSTYGVLEREEEHRYCFGHTGIIFLNRIGQSVNRE